MIEHVVETISMPAGEDIFESAGIIGFLEVSEEEFVGLRPRGPLDREVLTGLGFSVGMHAALLVLALLTVLFFVPPGVPGTPILKVSLVSLPGSCGTPEGSGSGGEKDDPGPAAPQAQAPAGEFPEPKARMSREETCRPPAERDTPAPRKNNALKKERIAVTKKTAAEPIRKTVEKTAKCESPAARSSTNQQIPDGGEGPGSARPGGPSAGETAGDKAGGGAAGGVSHGPGGGGLKEFDSDKVDTPPAAIRKVEPEFPQAARRMGITGRVVLKFLVKIDGSVGKASVIEANPSGIFEQSALEAIDKWRFKPGRHRGDAVATWVLLPIQFRLSR